MQGLPVYSVFDGIFCALKSFVDATTLSLEKISHRTIILFPNDLKVTAWQHMQSCKRKSPL